MADDLKPTGTPTGAPTVTQTGAAGAAPGIPPRPNLGGGAGAAPGMQRPSMGAAGAAGTGAGAGAGGFRQNPAGSQAQGQAGSQAQGGAQAKAAPASGNAELVMSIPVEVQIVLGSTTMPVATLMNLGRGAVITLDKQIGDPVDIVVNGRVIARGEVIVLEDDSSRFGVSLIEVMGK